MFESLAGFLYNLDLQALLLVNTQWTNPLFDWLFPTITDLHQNAIFDLLAGLLIGLFICREKKTGAIRVLGLALVMGISDSLAGNLIKPLFGRIRPTHVVAGIINRSPEFGGFSFPSNHSVNMFCLATLVFFFYPRISILFYFIAAVVAYSRVYNGVHYPSDVLGGALLGVFFAWLGYGLARKILAHLNPHQGKH